MIRGRYSSEGVEVNNFPDNVLLHNDCFRLYKNISGGPHAALLHLASVALWRQPWSRATVETARRPLSPQSFSCSKEALQYALGRIGFSRFSSLPLELVLSVYEMSSQALLWDVVKAATIALTAQRSDNGLVTRVRVADVKAWERGQSAPDLTGSANCPSIIQITIDSLGINRVARLEEQYQVQLTSSPPDMEFIVLDESEFGDVEFLFKVRRVHPANLVRTYTKIDTRMLKHVLGFLEATQVLRPGTFQGLRCLHFHTWGRMTRRTVGPEMVFRAQHLLVQCIT
jgi:hypothetical protein